MAVRVVKFKLNRVSPIRGDETATYEVALDKNCTVKELLDAVLSITDEWGYLSIKNGNSCEYKWGKLLSNFGKDDLDKIVLKVTASGGWSRMDYYVTVE